MQMCHNWLNERSRVQCKILVIFSNDLIVSIILTEYGKEVGVDLTNMKSDQINKAMETLVTTQPQ